MPSVRDGICDGVLTCLKTRTTRVFTSEVEDVGGWTHEDDGAPQLSRPDSFYGDSGPGVSPVPFKEQSNPTRTVPALSSPLCPDGNGPVRGKTGTPGRSHGGGSIYPNPGPWGGFVRWESSRWETGTQGTGPRVHPGPVGFRRGRGVGWEWGVPVSGMSSGSCRAGRQGTRGDCLGAGRSGVRDAVGTGKEGPDLESQGRCPTPDTSHRTWTTRPHTDNCGPRVGVVSSHKRHREYGGAPPGGTPGRRGRGKQGSSRLGLAGPQDETCVTHGKGGVDRESLGTVPD